MDEDEVESIEELVRKAEGSATALAQRIFDLGEDSPRVQAFSQHGVPLWSRAVQSGADVTAIGNWQAQPGADCAGGVLLDNTTLQTAWELTAGRTALTPATLWDLATVVSALIVHDRVFHMAHKGIDDSAWADIIGEDVVRPLWWPEHDSHKVVGAGGFLDEMWYDAMRVLKILQRSEGQDTVPGRQLVELSEGWSRALGRTVAPREVIDPVGVDRRWDTPTDRLIRQMTMDTRIAGSLEEVDRSDSWRGRDWLSESAFRGHLAQRLADAFGLPYLPSIVRMPFQRTFYQRPKAVSNRLRSIELADAGYADRVATAHRLGEASFGLPVMLAVVLAETSDTSKLWEAVASWRQRARRFREVRAELDAKLADGDIRTVETVRRAVVTDATLLCELAGSATRSALADCVESMTGGAVIKAAEPQLGLLTASVSAFVAGGKKLLPAGVRNRLYWRLARPHYRFLSDVRTHSGALVSALPRVQALWSIPDSAASEFASRLEVYGGFREQ